MASENYLTSRVNHAVNQTEDLGHGSIGQNFWRHAIQYSLCVCAFMIIEWITCIEMSSVYNGTAALCV